MTTTPRHWSESALYQAARTTGDQTQLAWWVYQVACYVSGITEPEAVAIAQVAVREHCGVWHATWIWRGKVGECYCANCRPRATRVIYDAAPDGPQ